MFTNDKVSKDTVIKLYYVKKEAKIKVIYRDLVTGEEIEEYVEKTGNFFDTYDITEDKKEIEGYTLIEIPLELEGEYTEEEQTKVYAYAKNSRVVVNYKEKYTEENLIEPSIINGFETKKYETEEKIIDNYTLCYFSFLFFELFCYIFH